MVHVEEVAAGEDEAAVSECPALSNWEVYAIVHFWPFISDSRSTNTSWLGRPPRSFLIEYSMLSLERLPLFLVADLLRPDGGGAADGRLWAVRPRPDGAESLAAAGAGAAGGGRTAQ